MSKEKEKSLGIGKWLFLFVLFVAIGIAVHFAFPEFISHERTIEISNLKSEIKAINELASLKYEYGEVVIKDKKDLLDGRLIAKFNGTIKAGVDLKNAKVDVDKPESDSEEPIEVTIYLPEAKILSHEDNNPKTVYEDGISRKNLGKKRNQAIKEKKQEVQKAFVKAGNLDKARDNAKSAIEDLIHSSYGEDVVVNFEDIK